MKSPQLAAKARGYPAARGTGDGLRTERSHVQGAGLNENVSGLAWEVVASLMDLMPGHSIGINYARTGAGWFLSPQFRPNEELFEIRYQWRPENFPLFEWRVRRREDLIKPVDAIRKRDVFDMYLRLTWEF